MKFQRIIKENRTKNECHFGGIQRKTLKFLILLFLTQLLAHNLLNIHIVVGFYNNLTSVQMFLIKFLNLEKKWYFTQMGAVAYDSVLPPYFRESNCIEDLYECINVKY